MKLVILPLLYISSHHPIWTFQFDTKFVHNLFSPEVESNGLFGYSVDVIKSGDISVLVGAPKDGAGGSFSVCSLDSNLNGNGNAECRIRNPDLSSADPNDSFDDQMLGISVLGMLEEKSNSNGSSDSIGKVK